MKLCSTGEMEDVAVDMSNHFLGGMGTDYSNNVLTKHIAENKNTEECVDSLYGNRFEIVSYNFDGKNYEYTLKFTFYDIFGLNKTDIAPEEMKLFEYGDIQGFRSWYILQHYDLYKGAYQPYITYMSFERTIKGSIK